MTPWRARASSPQKSCTPGGIQRRASGLRSLGLLIGPVFELRSRVVDFEYAILGLHAMLLKCCHGGSARVFVMVPAPQQDRRSRSAKRDANQPLYLQP